MYKFSICSFKFIDSGKSKPSSNQRYPLYNLEKNDIGQNIKLILNSHNKKNLTKEEIKDYIWESNVKEFSFKNFV